MTNVVELPDSMRRQWRVFEKELRIWLLSQGCTDAEANYACNQLKPIYLEHAAPERYFSGNPEDVLREFNDWVQGIIHALLVTVASRDVELYRLRGDG